MSYQVFIAVGNVTRDPEIRKTKNGDKFASFGLATNEFVKGESKAEFHNVTVWDPRLAEIVEKYVQKGTAVQITGRVRTTKRDDKYFYGIFLERFHGELQILGNRKNGGSQQAPASDMPFPGDEPAEEMSLD